MNFRYIKSYVPTSGFAMICRSNHHISSLHLLLLEPEQEFDQHLAQTLNQDEEQYEELDMDPDLDLDQHKDKE